MEISSTTTAHHQRTQKLTAAGASSSMEEVVAVSCNFKPRQPSPAATVERKPRPDPDKEIECARCNSTKTKFCYYNNYSMAQPSYFCKQCRRYWTQGGSLRNVPIGGGCRKNRRSSSTSASAASKINKLMPEAMVPPDFPDVLPTYSSTGFGLPRDHLSLAFASSSSNPAATLAPGGTFLDVLTGGLLDGNHRSNGHYGPIGGDGMVMPPTTFGLNLTMQQHGLGGTADHAIGGTAATQGVPAGSMDAGEEGGGGVKAMMGLQWPSQLGGGGSAGRQLQVGAEQQQQGTVMMDNDDDDGCYWNNAGVGAGTSSANPWQALINSSSQLI